MAHELALSRVTRTVIDMSPAITSAGPRHW
jgi:hypothetical protein